MRQSDEVYQFKEDWMGGSCVTDGRKEKLCRGLVAKPELKGPLGRKKCRRVKQSICRMDFKDVDRINWFTIDTNSRLL